MDRRVFLTGLGAVLAAPGAIEAQQVGKVRRVGVVSPTPDPGQNPIQDAFEQTLQGLGWIKDQSIRIDIRYAGGRQDTAGPLITQFVDLAVDVLVVWGLHVAVAAKQATREIPVVFLAAGEPIDAGLVSDLSRPGVNVTGVTNEPGVEIFAKRLQILKAAIPSLTRVARLSSLEETDTIGAKRTLGTAASALNLELQPNWLFSLDSCVAPALPLHHARRFV